MTKFLVMLLFAMKTAQPLLVPATLRSINARSLLEKCFNSNDKSSCISTTNYPGNVLTPLNAKSCPILNNFFDEASLSKYPMLSR